MSGWTILTKYVYALRSLCNFDVQRKKKDLQNQNLCFHVSFFQILEGRISEAMMIVIVKLVNMYMFAKKFNIYLPY